MTSAAGALVEVDGLVKHFPGERGFFGLGRPHTVVRAVDDVSFAIPAGQTLAWWASRGAASPR